MRLPQLRLRRNEFMASGNYPRKMPAKTLYELLGVRPDTDAKTLHSAFRDAAKEHHPDRNPGDPDATRRFTQIVNAYGILRNAEQRGVYDEMLASESERRRARLMRTVSEVVGVVALSAVMVGGFALFVQVSRTSVETAGVDAAARKPDDIVVVQPTMRTATADRDKPSERFPKEIVVVPKASASTMNAGAPPAPADGGLAEMHVAEPAAATGTSPQDLPSDKSAPVEFADTPVVPNASAREATSHEPSTIADGDPAPDPTGSKSELAEAVDALMAAVDRGDMGKSKVAKAVDALLAAIDRGDMGKTKFTKAVDALLAAIDRGELRSGSDDQKGSDESHPLDQTRAGSVEPRSQSSENNKSPSSHWAIVDEKHDVRTNAKLPAHAKRPATDRTTVGQAAAESRDVSQVALASRNASPCSGSCSSEAPPIFGIGF
jgi:hypothetical protein